VADGPSGILCNVPQVCGKYSRDGSGPARGFSNSRRASRIADATAAAPASAGVTRPAGKTVDGDGLRYGSHGFYADHDSHALAGAFVVGTAGARSCALVAGRSCIEPVCAHDFDRDFFAGARNAPSRGQWRMAGMIGDSHNKQRSTKEATNSGGWYGSQERNLNTLYG
jgi:hypothetical protein